MSQTFSYKQALLQYRASGTMSRELYAALTRLVQVVLRSKGVAGEQTLEEVQGAFFEKLLKFKSVFYLRLELYAESQTRSFLAMTINSVAVTTLNPLAHSIAIDVSTGPDEVRRTDGSLVSQGVRERGVFTAVVVWHAPNWIVRDVDLDAQQ